jgi:hypothetical protein
MIPLHPLFPAGDSFLLFTLNLIYLDNPIKVMNEEQ